MSNDQALQHAREPNRAACHHQLCRRRYRRAVERRLHEALGRSAAGGQRRDAIATPAATSTPLAYRFPSIVLIVPFFVWMKTLGLVDS